MPGARLVAERGREPGATRSRPPSWASRSAAWRWAGSASRRSRTRCMPWFAGCRCRWGARVRARHGDRRRVPASSPTCTSCWASWCRAPSRCSTPSTWRCCSRARCWRSRGVTRPLVGAHARLGPAGRAAAARARAHGRAERALGRGDRPAGRGGQEAGVIPADEAKYVRNVFELVGQDRPRRHGAAREGGDAVAGRDARSEILETSRETAHTRMPVWEGDPGAHRRHRQHQGPVPHLQPARAGHPDGRHVPGARRAARAARRAACWACSAASAARWRSSRTPRAASSAS